ncbi:hypothetical protein QLG10_16145, partial [Pseudomonas sp. V98_8]|uniref:hypothetical protein n=1 Tax=Pseudomonas sp. V98_8 TaxID=3044228 RepID=UPI00249E9449
METAPWLGRKNDVRARSDCTVHAGGWRVDLLAGANTMTSSTVAGSTLHQQIASDTAQSLWERGG